MPLYNPPAGGGISDGDKGDITVSGSGATFTIDPGAVTLAKQADMATASILGRNTAGAGSPEVLSASTARTVLGLGSAALSAASDFAPASVTDTVASATTLAFTGDYALVTGTTAIEAIHVSPASEGKRFWLRFESAGCTVFHDATELIFQNGLGLGSDAGTVALFICESGTNVRCLGWWRGDGKAVTGESYGDDSTSGIYSTATQSNQETATSLSTVVTPGRQKFHPTACKCWADISGSSTTPNASYNVASVSNDTGETVVTIATDFSSANYAVVASVERNNDTTTVTSAKSVVIRSGTQAAGAVTLQCWDATATNNVIEDPTSFYCCMFGDQ